MSAIRWTDGSTACHRSSISGYADGCRCPGCREAEMRKQADRRNARRRADGASEACLICGRVYHDRGHMYGHETRAHRVAEMER